MYYIINTTQRAALCSFPQQHVTQKHTGVDPGALRPHCSTARMIFSFMSVLGSVCIMLMSFRHSVIVVLRLNRVVALMAPAIVLRSSKGVSKRSRSTSTCVFHLSKGSPSASLCCLTLTNARRMCCPAITYTRLSTAFSQAVIRIFVSGGLKIRLHNVLHM